MRFTAHHMLGLIAGGAAAGGVWTYKQFKIKKATLQRRLEKCESLERNPKFKTDLKLVKYKGCVVNSDMVLSGTLEEVEKFNTTEEDVIASSFPKSGTTWLQEVIYKIYMNAAFNVTDAAEMQKFIEILERSGSTMEDRFPYLEHVYPGLEDLKKRKGIRLIKTHLPIHLLPRSINEKQTKVIYIRRNPKDCVTSYYYFAKGLKYISFEGSLEEFSDHFMNDEVPYSPYDSHVKGYTEASRKNRNILIVSFEDMKMNPEKVIGRIAEFLGVKLSDKDLTVISLATSFDSMKENPLTNYEHWDILGLRNPGEHKFMRKGKRIRQFGQKSNVFINTSLLQEKWEIIKKK